MSRDIIPIHQIANAIHVFGGQKVILDSDLALLYGVPTGHLNRAVKRNLGRFPSEFMFQLDSEEARSWRCQIGISNQNPGLKSQSVISRSGRGGGPYPPTAFTEQGVAMLSSVLNSERAVRVNIAIMRAFVKLRETLATNRELARKFADLEKRIGQHDNEIAAIIEAIRQLMAPPTKPQREIGFHVRETTIRYRMRPGSQRNRRHV